MLQSVLKFAIFKAETYQKGNAFLIGDAAHCHSPGSVKKYILFTEFWVCIFTYKDIYVL